MFNSKKIVVLFILCIFTSAWASITIDMHPEELQSIGAVLVESYMRHNLIQRQETVTRMIFNKMGKFLAGLLQMLSITTSLIAANIFTPYFQLGSQPIIDTTIGMQKNVKITSTPATIDQCPNDFGCERNLCWRTCDQKFNVTKDAWCYTSPTPQNRKHTHCTSHLECSPCWECISVCNIPHQRRKSHRNTFH